MAFIKFKFSKVFSAKEKIQIFYLKNFCTATGLMSSFYDWLGRLKKERKKERNNKAKVKLNYTEEEELKFLINQIEENEREVYLKHFHASSSSLVSFLYSVSPSQEMKERMMKINREKQFETLGLLYHKFELVLKERKKTIETLDFVDYIYRNASFHIDNAVVKERKKRKEKTY